jgi:hypothetical protein
MMSHGKLSLSLCAVALSAALTGPAAPPQALRLESVATRSLHVYVRSTPGGLWLDSTAASPVGDRVVPTPAVVHVADSVRTVDLRVLDRGAVRIQFQGRSSRTEQRVLAWGGEITLSRTEDGFLSPVWKVRPLP